MNNTRIRLWGIGLALLLWAVPAQGATLAALRSKLNHYISDSSSIVLPAYVKDSVLNNAMLEYCASYPVVVDTNRQTVAKNTRFYALPSTYGGQVLSVHTMDEAFTELPYMPTDTNVTFQGGLLEYFSTRDNILILYPKPPGENDTVFYWYSKIPPVMAGDTSECQVDNHLEEPVMLLAASKCLLMNDLNVALSQVYAVLYEATAQRLTRRDIEKSIQR